MTLRPIRLLPLVSALLAVVGCLNPAPIALPTATPGPAATRSPLATPAISPSPTAPRPSPSRDPNVQRRLVFQGITDFSLEGPFELVAGERTFRCYYDGRSGLSVTLIRDNGEEDAALFNRLGPFSDAAKHRVDVRRAYRLQVIGANGPWRIEVE